MDLPKPPSMFRVSIVQPGEKFDKIPIGKPIDNIFLYILGKNLNLQPFGCAGELCIGGVGLGRGYLNRTELTVKDLLIFNEIWVAGGIFYITPGTWHGGFPDGNIEYLGRIDFQVKIRGFRIELGEIENQLALCKG